jgi:ABC-type Fe3+ transport system permease subunit
MDFPLQNWDTLPLGIIAAVAVAIGAALLARALFRKIRKAQRIIAAVSAMALLVPGGAGITHALNDLKDSAQSYYSVDTLKKGWDKVNELGK